MAKRAALLGRQQADRGAVSSASVSEKAGAGKAGAPAPAADSNTYQCPARNGTRPEATGAEKKAARNTYGYRRRQRRYSFEQYPKVPP